MQNPKATTSQMIILFETGETCRYYFLNIIYTPLKIGFILQRLFYNNLKVFTPFLNSRR